jgi:hypothetical protein
VLDRSDFVKQLLKQIPTPQEIEKRMKRKEKKDDR